MSQSDQTPPGTPDAPPVSPDRRRRRRRRIAVVLVALLVLAIGLPGAGWLALQSAWGKARLTQFVAQVASAAPDRVVEIGELTGAVPFGMRLDRVRVADRDGVWLEVSGIRLDIRAADLLRGKLNVTELHADVVRVDRPLLSEDDEEEPKPIRLPELPDAARRLRVERLRVDRVALGEAIHPEAPVFEIYGRLAPDASSGMQARLDLAALEGPETRGTVSATLAGSPPMLDLSIDFDEDGAGLVSRALRLPVERPLRVHLAMNGPLEAWAGRLEVACGTDVLLQGDQTIAVADDRIDADVRLRFTPLPRLVPPAAEAIAADGVDLLLRAGLVDRQRIEIAEARVTARGVDLHASGSADFDAQELDLAARVEAPEVAELLPEQGISGAAEVAVKLTGAPRQPEAALRFTVANLVASDVTVARADGELALAWEPDATGAPTATAVGSGAIRGLVREGLPEALRDDLTWRLDAAYAEQVATVRELVLASTAELVSATLRADFSSPDLVFEGAVASPDLAAWRLSQLADASGVVRLHFDGMRNVEDGLRVAFDAVGENLTGLPDAASAAVAGGVAARGIVRIPPTGVIAIEEGEVTGEAFAASLHGTFAPETRELAFTFGAEAPDLARLEAAAGRPIRGAFRADGEVSGALDAIGIKAEAVVEGLHAAGLADASGTVRIEATGLPGAPTGGLDASMRMGGETARVVTRFASDDAAIRLSELTIRAPGVDGSGALTFDIATRGVSGDLSLTADDLSRVGAWAGVDLAGAMQAALTAGMDRGRQTIVLDGNLSELRFGETTVARATISAQATDPAGDRSAEFAVAASDALAGAARIADLTVTGALAGDAVDFTLAAEGALRETPWRATASGDAAYVDAGVSGRIASLDAVWDETPIVLRSGGAFAIGPDGAIVEPLEIALGDGQVAVQARLDGDTVDGLVEATGLPLALAAPVARMPLGGSLDGRIALTGAADAPRVSVDLSAQDVTGLQGTGRLGPLSVEVAATLAGGMLDARAEAIGLFDDPVTAEGRVPVAFSARPPAFALDPSAPIAGRIAIKGDLSTIAEMVLLDGQELQGALEGDLQLAGIVSEPRVTGVLAIREGLYQHYLQGVVLRDIQAELRGEGAHIDLARLEATDGGRGTISGNGTIELNFAEKLPYDISIRLNRATLLRHDERTATLDGDVRLAGDLGEGAVTGALTVGPAEILIPTRTPTRMRDVEVVTARGPDEKGEDEEPTPPIPNFRDRLRLGLDVSMPDRVFVRGMGLDSEWQGQFRVAGTAARPAVTGSLASIRGSMNFLGRVFTLQQGEVSLGGQYPPAPILQVVAATHVEDIDALITLSGPTDQPELALASSPPLPEDEILARVLFGRNLSKVTPLQALQLARAAEALRSGGGAPSVMDKTRKALALDDIDFAQQEGAEGATVGVGKYLTDEIYLRVEQGIGADSTRMQVNVEFSPTLSVEAGADNEANSEIKLLWKRDY